MDRVFVTVHKYGNMSAATVPVALVEALEDGRVKPGALLLTPAFGAGLTWCSHVIRWGERVTPLDDSRRRSAALRAEPRSSWSRDYCAGARSRTARSRAG